MPQGGVLPAAAYRLTGRNGELPESVSVALGGFLAQRELDGVPLAVRSSATAEDSCRASFAGFGHRAIQ